MSFSDKTILKSIKNPCSLPYEITIETKELTFLGDEHKPDFGTVEIIMYPTNKVIELKSLKYYFYNFRNKRISYERIINTIYKDLLEIYKPNKLKIIMKFGLRGGISSKLMIDSSIRNSNVD